MSILAYWENEKKVYLPYPNISYENNGFLFLSVTANGKLDSHKEREHMFPYTILKFSLKKYSPFSRRSLKPPHPPSLILLHLFYIIHKVKKIHRHLSTNLWSKNTTHVVHSWRDFQSRVLAKIAIERSALMDNLQIDKKKKSSKISNQYNEAGLIFYFFLYSPIVVWVAVISGRTFSHIYIRNWKTF